MDPFSHGKAGHVTTKNAHVFHLRDGIVTEFWYVSTHQYAVDELIG
jgi:hypothetical protein